MLGNLELKEKVYTTTVSIPVTWRVRMNEQGITLKNAIYRGLYGEGATLDKLIEVQKENAELREKVRKLSILYEQAVRVRDYAKA